MMLKQHLMKLLQYKAWANHLVFSSLMELPTAEIEKKRMTNFKNIIRTLNHVFVVDDIFKAHLSYKEHTYVARNTKETPTLNDLWQTQQAIDHWYIDYLQSLPEQKLDEQVEFTFVGGGEGKMNRADIIAHIVNHGTYHRGFVSDMMYQIPVRPTPNDYPVFLRDAL